VVENVAGMRTVNRAYHYQVAPYTPRAANPSYSTYVQTELHKIFRRCIFQTVTKVEGLITGHKVEALFPVGGISRELILLSGLKYMIICLFKGFSRTLSI
jgi:hypothetical protein